MDRSKAWHRKDILKKRPADRLFYLGREFTVLSQYAFCFNHELCEQEEEQDEYETEIYKTQSDCFRCEIGEGCNKCFE